MSQLDTQPDPPAPHLRLSQADTVADDTDPSRIPAGWSARLPDDAPCSPFVDPPSLLTASSCRGALPPPVPAPVSGPAPSVQLCSLELLPRSCHGQRRHLRPPLSLRFTVSSYFCSKCPRRGFQSAKGLMRYITHHHTGSVVDEDTCALFVAIKRVTCSTPSCGGLRRSGESVQPLWAGHAGAATSRGARLQLPLLWLAPRMA